MGEQYRKLNHGLFLVVTTGEESFHASCAFFLSACCVLYCVVAASLLLRHSCQPISELGCYQVSKTHGNFKGARHLGGKELIELLDLRFM